MCTVGGTGLSAPAKGVARVPRLSGCETWDLSAYGSCSGDEMGRSCAEDKCGVRNQTGTAAGALQAPVRALLFGLLPLLLLCGMLNAQTVRLRNQTDWWSMNNGVFQRVDAKAQNERIASGTFEIAGVTLGPGQFRRLAATLGKAPVVTRGDASTGRQQVCYESARDSSKVYLIFEFGEDESVFYLFRDGARWDGQQLCVTTRHVSSTLGTASGLRLGLTIAQVQAILGKAGATFPEKLVYFREVQERATPAQFKELRSDYPEQLSDRAAHDKFDYYPVRIYVEARFAQSRLNYLAVSRSRGID